MGAAPPSMAKAASERQRPAWDLLFYVMAFRTSGFQGPVELGPPDLAAMNFLYQLAEIAAAGGDIRDRLFG
jgi:hypothetical protein